MTKTADTLLILAGLATAGAALYLVRRSGSLVSPAVRAQATPWKSSGGTASDYARIRPDRYFGYL